MDIASDQALRIALVHENSSVIKQLQAELRRVKAAHKRTRDEYESLQSLAYDGRYDYVHLKQCAHCRKWHTWGD